MAEVWNAPAFHSTPYIRFVATAAAEQVRKDDGLNIIYYAHPRTAVSAADYGEGTDLSAFDRFAAYQTVPVVARHTPTARTLIADTLNAAFGTTAFTAVPPAQECLELLQRAYAQNLVVASDQRQLLIFVDGRVPDCVRTNQRLDFYTCHIVAYEHRNVDAMKSANSAAVPGVYYRAFNCALPHMMP